jgi:hypothetical protein
MAQSMRLHLSPDSIYVYSHVYPEAIHTEPVHARSTYVTDGIVPSSTAKRINIDAKANDSNNKYIPDRILGRN